MYSIGKMHLQNLFLRQGVLTLLTRWRSEANVGESGIIVLGLGLGAIGNNGIGPLVKAQSQLVKRCKTRLNLMPCYKVQWNNLQHMSFLDRNE